MGDVKPWSAEVGIDDQFGWNDFLITGEVGKGGEISIKPLDHFSEDTVKEISQKGNGFPTAAQFRSNPMFRPGDQIFQYGKDGPLIVRRSIFTDECSKIEPNFLYQFQSEDEVRAFAAFSGGKAHDDPWCGAEVQGLKSESSTRTPWDLSTLTGLKEMKTALDAIKAAKADKSKDKLGLAAAVDKKRLDAIEEDLDRRISVLEPTWYDKISLLPGIGFALGGGIIGGIWLLFKLVASRVGKDGGDGDGNPPSSGGGSGKAKVAYKGAGAALLGSGENKAFDAAQTSVNPTVAGPQVQGPNAARGTVGLPNSVPAPRVVPELVPVVP